MLSVVDQLATRADLIPKDPAPELIKSMTWQVSMLAVTVILAALVFGYALRTWRTDGKVEMDTHGVLDDDDIADGIVLGCQARPSSERIRIEF